MSEEVVIWKAIPQLESEIMDDVENAYKWVVRDEQSIYKTIGWTNRFVRYNTIHAVPSKYHKIKLKNGLVFKLKRVYTAEGFTGIEGVSGLIQGEYKISKAESVEYLWRLIKKLQERVWRLEDLVDRLKEEVWKKND